MSTTQSTGHLFGFEDQMKAADPKAFQAWYGLTNLLHRGAVGMPATSMATAPAEVPALRKAA